MSRFDGRCAVVTGGAGEIGAATCLRLAADGARVFVVDLDEAGMRRTVEAVRRAGGEAAGTAADVTDAESVARYVDAAAAFGGGSIDCFYNNAGVEGPVTAIVDTADDDWDRTIAVNVRGVFLGLKHVIPAMPDGAAIVNTGSTAALAGSANMVAYCASKHAVLGITRAAAQEVTDRRIRINCVCPGPIDGRMMTAIEDAYGIADAHEVFRAGVPFGRYGKVEEVAATVAFLLSDEASFITGAHLACDGAQTAR